MPLLAHLDDHLVLTGFKKVSIEDCVEAPNVIPLPDQDECDLEPNKYKWDASTKAFIPLGFGFGKPKSGPRMNTEMLLYLLAESLINQGIDIPQRVREWCEWYNSEIAKREEELLRKAQG